MRLLLACVLALTLATPRVAPAAAASCQFVLGFLAIHQMIPTLVGDCLVDEHHNPVNGDGLQETTVPTGAGGLLVWRKADNWTAYTDGYHTWVNGPNGLQERLNTERFPWEGDASTFLTPTPAPAGLGFTAIVGGPPGGTASVSFQTTPSASCSINYVTPSGTDSVALGLDPKMADATGHVSWSWVIGPKTAPGIGTVTVTCNGTSVSGGITID